MPSEQFYQSTNGGATWVAIANVTEVYCFGFGAPAPGQSYPSIYIVGSVNNVYGIWESDNNAQSWTQIGTYPTGNLDLIQTISGDPNIYGQVYVGFPVQDMPTSQRARRPAPRASEHRVVPVLPEPGLSSPAFPSQPMEPTSTVVGSTSQPKEQLLWTCHHLAKIPALSSHQTNSSQRRSAPLISPDSASTEDRLNGRSALTADHLHSRSSSFSLHADPVLASLMLQ